MKHYANCAVGYALTAMIGGVFYRELTKAVGFSGSSALSVLHTHYFVLGMFFFLMLLLLEKSFSFTQSSTKKALVLYHIGLNLTGIMLLTRGLLTVLAVSFSTGLNAAVSGIAGIGHILMSVGLVLLLLQIRKAVLSPSSAARS